MQETDVGRSPIVGPQRDRRPSWDRDSDPGVSPLAFIPPLLLIVAVFVADANIAPTMRDVSWYKDGPSISFPLRPSTVTEADVAVLALGVPLTVFGAVGYWKQDRAGTALAALALAETLSMSLSITVVGKKAAGSLRPCFIAMCEWDNKTETCGAPRAVALDARQSFPSGHSSTCGAALGLLSLFLNHHVCLLTAPSPLRPKTGLLGPLLRPLAWLPLLGAFLVGVSRFLDNHHRPEDIAAGLGIGVGSAAFVFGSHFRPWWDGAAARGSRRRAGGDAEAPFTEAPFMDGEGLLPPLLDAPPGRAGGGGGRFQQV